MSALDVLLVDDDPADALLVEEALLDVPGSVVLRHATGMDEAHRLAVQRRPDVVLHDLNLPGSLGLETVRRALRDHVGTPVVVLTGTDDTRVAVDAVALGVEDFVAKDRLDGAALARVLRLAVERSRGRAEDARLADDRERLVAVAGHELRSPVAAARGLLTLLRDRSVDLDEETRADVLDRAIRAVERLEDLTEDLLAMARLGDGGDEVVPAQLGPALDRAIEDSRLGPDDVDVDVDPTHHVLVVERTLSLMLRNLLDNAAVHGGPPFHVRADVDGAVLRIEVLDRGPGVPEDQRDAVLSPYVRVDGGLRPGSGLGLSIVNRAARAAGGGIRIGERADGPGCAARLTLALATAD